MNVGVLNSLMLNGSTVGGDEIHVFSVPFGDMIVTTPQGDVKNILPKGEIRNTIPRGDVLI